MPDLRRRTRAMLVMASLAAGAAALSPGAKAAGNATHEVRGSIQQAFRGALAVPNRLHPPHTVGLRNTNPLRLSATYLGRKSAEPTIGVTKEGNAFMVAADFDGLSPVTPRTKIYATYDHNGSWHDVSPTVGPVDFPPTTLDPYLYVDPDTGRIFSDDLTVACSVLIHSDDQGHTWSPGSPVACDGPVDDHQTVVAGHPPQGVTTIGYPNVIYYCVNKIGVAECGRSLDGGTTFSATGAPAFTGVDPATGANVCGSLHGHIATDAQGRLYLPKGHCGQPWLAVSEDGGLTWRRTLVNAKIGAAGIQTSVAIDKAGIVYYTWWDSINKLPYLAVSHDAGKTFGPARLIAPPGVVEVNFPVIAAGARGQLAISFPGTTSTDTKNGARPWNYYVLTTAEGDTPTPRFASATANPANDPIHRGACQGRCAGMYDFLDVLIAPDGGVWASAVDTCTGKCVGTEDAKAGAKVATDAQGVGVRALSGPGVLHRT